MENLKGKKIEEIQPENEKFITKDDLIGRLKELEAEHEKGQAVIAQTSQEVLRIEGAIAVLREQLNQIVKTN